MYAQIDHSKKQIIGNFQQSAICNLCKRKYDPSYIRTHLEYQHSQLYKAYSLQQYTILHYQKINYPWNTFITFQPICIPCPPCYKIQQYIPYQDNNDLIKIKQIQQVKQSINPKKKNWKYINIRNNNRNNKFKQQQNDNQIQTVSRQRNIKPLNIRDKIKSISPKMIYLQPSKKQFHYFEQNIKTGTTKKSHDTNTNTTGYFIDSKQFLHKKIFMQQNNNDNKPLNQVSNKFKRNIIDFNSNYEPNIQLNYSRNQPYSQLNIPINNNLNINNQLLLTNHYQKNFKIQKSQKDYNYQEKPFKQTNNININNYYQYIPNQKVSFQQQLKDFNKQIDIPTKLNSIKKKIDIQPRLKQSKNIRRRKQRPEIQSLQCELQQRKPQQTKQERVGLSRQHIIFEKRKKNNDKHLHINNKNLEPKSILEKPIDLRKSKLFKQGQYLNNRKSITINQSQVRKKQIISQKIKQQPLKINLQKSQYKIQKNQRNYRNIEINQQQKILTEQLIPKLQYETQSIILKTSRQNSVPMTIKQKSYFLNQKNQVIYINQFAKPKKLENQQIYLQKHLKINQPNYTSASQIIIHQKQKEINQREKKKKNVYFENSNEYQFQQQLEKIKFEPISNIQLKQSSISTGPQQKLTVQNMKINQKNKQIQNFQLKLNSIKNKELLKHSQSHIKINEKQQLPKSQINLSSSLISKYGLKNNEKQLNINQKNILTLIKPQFNDKIINDNQNKKHLKSIIINQRNRIKQHNQIKQLQNFEYNKIQEIYSKLQHSNYQQQQKSNHTIIKKQIFQYNQLQVPDTIRQLPSRKMPTIPPQNARKNKIWNIPNPPPKRACQWIERLKKGQNWNYLKNRCCDRQQDYCNSVYSLCNYVNELTGKQVDRKIVQQMLISYYGNNIQLSIQQYILKYFNQIK